MIKFLVQDMTCGHCESTIRKAIAGLDPAAQVRIDLHAHLVEVEAGPVDSKALATAIRNAGYTPIPA